MPEKTHAEISDSLGDDAYSLIMDFDVDGNAGLATSAQAYALLAISEAVLAVHEDLEKLLLAFQSSRGK